MLTANLACERILERSIEELVIWNPPELLRRLLGRRADELPVAELLAQPIDEQHRPRNYSAVVQLGTRMISIALGPVLNSKDSLIGAVAVFRDINARDRIRPAEDRIHRHCLARAAHAHDLDQGLHPAALNGQPWPGQRHTEGISADHPD